MDDFSTMLDTAPQTPQHLDPRSMTRRADKIKSKLYIPFIILIIALALWALSRACVIAPTLLEPAINNLPDGLLKNTLIWLRDIASPIGHYTSKLFDWILPTATAIANWFQELFQKALEAFTTWVDSL